MEKNVNTDSYYIDHHKLMFHPKRVSHWVDANDSWEEAKKIYPIYVELSPSGNCNHRCTFCAMDYIGYKKKIVSVDIMGKRITEMAELGVKSIMFAGEGEPLLHENINELTDFAYKAGIDSAFTTNGVHLNRRFLNESLEKVSWIKFSLNAGTANTYGEIHRTNPDDFNLVLENIKNADEKRKKHGWKVTLGVQILLLPENESEIEELAGICRDQLGVDYLVIKPYSQHLFSKTRKYEKLNYDSYLYLDDKLKSYNTRNFKIIFRNNSMVRHQCNKSYLKCFSTPFFWAHIMTDGSLYSCSAFLKDERFKLGNLNEHSFQEIWEGKKREQNYNYMKHNMDINVCRNNCRMDKVNNYLWKLKNPDDHVNFI